MELIYVTEKDIRMTTESLSTVKILHEFKKPNVIRGMDINVYSDHLYWSSSNSEFGLLFLIDNLRILH